MGAAVLGTVLGTLHLAPTILSQAAPIAGPGVAFLALAGTLLALAALFRLWDRAATLGRRSAVGLASGLAYHLVAAHWIGEAFLAPGEVYTIRAALGVVGVLALLVPPWTAAFVAAHALVGRGARAPLVVRAVAFVLTVSIFDVALGDAVLGIPLGPLSLALLDTPWAGMHALLGLHGANALVVALATALGAIWTASRASCGLPGFIAAAVVLGLAAPLAHLATPASQEPDPDRVVRVALLQPGADAPVERMAHLTRRAFASGARLVVLPELAVPVDLASDADALIIAPLIEAIPEGGLLLAGHVRASQAPDGAFRLHNAMTALGPHGGPIASVDKAHLVPFGEVVPAPFRAMGFTSVVGPAGGYQAAPSMSVLRLEGVPPAAIALCYEMLLSGAISRETEGAHWILNASNEAAFGRTIGPALLLQHARLRAIETGLPAMRAAATGFSAAIGHDGAVQGVLPLDTIGLVLVDAPSAGPSPTPFRRTGQRPLFLAWAAAGLFVVASGAARTRRLVPSGAGRAL